MHYQIFLKNYIKTWTSVCCCCWIKTDSWYWTTSRVQWCSLILVTELNSSQLFLYLLNSNIENNGKNHLLFGCVQVYHVYRHDNCWSPASWNKWTNWTNGHWTPEHYHVKNLIVKIMFRYIFFNFPVMRWWMVLKSRRKILHRIFLSNYTGFFSATATPALLELPTGCTQEESAI